MERNYEIEDDYILDILEKTLDELEEELSNSLSEDMQFQFSKFLAVRNAIENINVKNALEKDHD